MSEAYGPLATRAQALYVGAADPQYGTPAEQWGTDTSFRCSATTGNPNGAPLPEWRRFDISSRAYIQFTDAGPIAKEGLRRSFCDLFMDNVARLMAHCPVGKRLSHVLRAMAPRYAGAALTSAMTAIMMNPTGANAIGPSARATMTTN
jgi:hypothetical protein